MRIDKWLWAARFFKTRSLAQTEIEKNRVMVNGHAVKPARELKLGDTLLIRQGTVHKTVCVLSMSQTRGPAPKAQLMYAETAESMANRIATAEQRRFAAEPATTIADGRPTKRDRRELDAAKNDPAGGWGHRWSAQTDDP